MSSFLDLTEKKLLERKNIVLEKLSEAYEEKLNDDMGKLHNRFVGFISMSRLPLPQVLLVLEMLRLETIEQARKSYLGEEDGKPSSG
uniref:Uncharacterized protein n=1 Tax=viral metagenome TaxID=1070528 RepID=A0A6M3KN40_9ZZZZ